MVIKEALKKYHQVEIELLLAHVLHKPREFLYINPQYKLSSYQVSSLSSLAKRRQAGEPIAYILGYKNFYGLKFKVNKDVLIPRPETEWIVERVIDVAQGRALPRPRERQAGYKAPIRILDVGTGSGCIAVSIAKQFSIFNFQFSITASDISPTALKVAKENAKTHKAKIKFTQSDLFKNISGKFDVIIANLPYVPAKYLKQNNRKRRWTQGIDYFAGLKFEPVFALTDGSNSFQIYRRFLEQVGGHINPGGTILFEIDPSARKFLTKYQKRYLPSGDLKFYRDFNKLWRYAEITI